MGRSYSQYKSISSLRKPIASKFDKQSPELSSSYLRNGKQAAVKETPGLVTKLTGTLNESSRCDYRCGSVRAVLDELSANSPKRQLCKEALAQLPRREKSSHSFCCRKIDPNPDLSEMTFFSTIDRTSRHSLTARSGFLEGTPSAVTVKAED